MKYLLRVNETRRYVSDYLVEARDEQEARRLARRGETLDEETLEFKGVLDREVDELIEACEPDEEALCLA